MKEYLSRYKYHAIWAGIFVFLVHGAKLNSNSIGIDTEDLIHLGKPFYDGWINTGRQGLVLLKYLTGSVEYNPYFAGLMTLVMLTAAVTAFVVLWDGVKGLTGSVNNWAGIGCMFLWIAHPVLVEQFYFTLQGAEIGMGMLLTALALGMIHKGIRASGGKRVCLLGCSGLLLLVTFSVYQIFVVMFIFGAVTLLLLDSLSEDDKPEGKKPLIGVVGDVFPYAGVFLTAFACNSVITGLFFSESDYLSNQIQWGQLSVRDCVYHIAIHVRDVLTGQNSIFYSWVFGCLCVVGLVAVTLLVKHCGLALLFYYVALMTTPFLMTVVCADVPAIRSQLILPAMTGFVFYLDILMMQKLGSMNASNIAQKKGKVRSVPVAVLAVLCVVGVMSEMQISMRLYYTDACRYAEDEALGRALIEQLEPLIGDDDTPVVVLGNHKFQGNNACVEGEIIGKSVFDHDMDEEPRYYWSTRRVIGFLHTLGYDCEQLPDRNIPYAVAFAEDMGAWPDKHSVEHAGDMVIIKLSE